MTDSTANGPLGLVLTGGGARCAYQLGVLKALAEWLPRGADVPFSVLTGTSAGAVSAVALASRSGDFRAATSNLYDVWADFEVSDVFRADTISMLRAGLHWFLAFVSSGLLLPPPRSLLDNSPLRELLKRTMVFRGIRRSIAQGRLRALGICATGFTGGRSVTFYEGVPGIEPWSRMTSTSRPVRLDLDHLMASLSIPFLFPPVQLNGEYYGDGAMRQSAPLSPAINLGASRLLIIGVRAPAVRSAFGPLEGARAPTPAQIFGYMLDTLFMDQIYADLEQLERLNHLVQHAPASFAGVRTIRALVIAPTVDLREIAARHLTALPRALRALLRLLGSQRPAASSLASYLMFESGYTRELIALGYADAHARRQELLDFLHPPHAATAAPAPVRELLSEQKHTA
jgi:NTE family protein